MTTEIQILVASVFLGMAHLAASAFAVNSKRGMRWAASARDQAPREVLGWRARLDRSFQNFKETYPFFVAAILAAYLISPGLPQAILGAKIYFWCRIVYIPLYVTGVPGLRSIVWFGACGGILMIAAAAAAV